MVMLKDLNYVLMLFVGHIVSLVANPPETGPRPAVTRPAQAAPCVRQEVSPHGPRKSELAVNDRGREVERAVDVDLLVYCGSVGRVRGERRLRALHRGQDVAGQRAAADRVEGNG